MGSHEQITDHIKWCVRIRENITTILEQQFHSKHLTKTRTHTYLRHTHTHTHSQVEEETDGQLQPRYIRNYSDSTLKDSPASKKRRRAAAETQQQPLAKKQQQQKKKPVRKKKIKPSSATQCPAGGTMPSLCLSRSIFLLLSVMFRLLFLFFFHHV